MGSAAFPVTILLGAALLSAGCGSSRTERSESDFVEEARKYEAAFRPSDFLPKPSPTTSDTEVKTPPVEERQGTLRTPQAPELIQGFRVQVFASTSIDAADSAKNEADELFPGEWFYVVYDPPTYKVRGGNFATRHEADRFAGQLRGRGYRDAWLVPERVYKDPAPRPPLQQPEE